MFDGINTLDTTTITISRNAIKARAKRFIIYDYDWLLDHLEQEVELLTKEREYRTKRRAEVLAKLRGTFLKKGGE
jgi:hypothetical protein